MLHVQMVNVFTLTSYFDSSPNSSRVSMQVVAAFAFWRRHQSRPRAVSDDTQMAKAL